MIRQDASNFRAINPKFTLLVITCYYKFVVGSAFYRMLPLKKTTDRSLNVLIGLTMTIQCDNAMFEQ